MTNVEIDGATALKLVKEVVAERGLDYVYYAPEDGSSCLYWHRPELADTPDINHGLVQSGPGCVVGAALHKFGVAPDVLERMDKFGTIRHAQAPLWEAGVFLSEQAAEVFQRAQWEQDAGLAYECVEKAAERAFSTSVIL